MPPTNPAVRPAHHGDSAALAALLAGQLHRQRLGAWLVPDPTARPAVLYSYARLVVAHALTHGRVDTTDDHTAVAIWHTPPAVTSTAGHDTLPLLPGGRQGRFALLHTYTATVHPHTPHHYLAHLAVRPDRHGTAAGHALLAHHRHTDPQAVGAYADVSTDRPGDHLLARAGYLPRTPILLAPGGPVLWRMWRPPHPARHPRSCGAELPRRVRLHRAATPFHGTVLTTATPRSP